MKLINAYQKIQDFQSRTEKIKTNLRTTDLTEQAQSIKDFIVSIESLNLVSAIKSISEYFQKMSQKSDDKTIREMFTTWSELLSERSDDTTEMLESFGDGVKEMVNAKTSLHNDLLKKDQSATLDKALGFMIQGISIYIDSFDCLSVIPIIMKDFVIPTMTEEELTPEMEFNINPN